MDWMFLWRLGRGIGKFVGKEAFTIDAFLRSSLEGETRVGDVLKTPDGRLLVVKSIEKRHKRVERAVASDRDGIRVEGLG